MPLSHPINALKRGWHKHAFVAAWLRSPLAVGAVAPSSRVLARAMARLVDSGGSGAVVELGAGTGNITKALLRRGVLPENLLVIERSAKLHRYLTLHFPQLTCTHADARDLSLLLSERNIIQVNAVVSALPLLSLPADTREDIITQIAQALGEEGIWVQFTYGLGSPVDEHTLSRHGLEGRHIRRVLWNLPPAHVWVYRRKLA